MSKEGHFPHDLVDTDLILICQLRFYYISIWVVSPVLAYKVSNLLLVTRCHTACSKLYLEHLCVEFFVECKFIKMCLRHLGPSQTIRATLENFLSLQRLDLPFDVCDGSWVLFYRCYCFSDSVSKLELSIHLNLMRHATCDTCTKVYFLYWLHR